MKAIQDGSVKNLDDPGDWPQQPQLCLTVTLTLIHIVVQLI